ncbi:unnamed protein product [Effrenium voratum]|nr:unnamed protein product [Effrenium voratum]
MQEARQAYNSKQMQELALGEAEQEDLARPLCLLGLLQALVQCAYWLLFIHGLWMKAHCSWGTCRARAPSEPERGDVSESFWSWFRV